MKKTLMIAAVALLAAICGCKKEEAQDDRPQEEKIGMVGCWELTGVSTKSAQLGSQTVEVYVKFEVGKFNLYQKIGSEANRYSAFSGTFALSGNVLSGKYDGAKNGWPRNYTVDVAGETMTLTCEKEADTYKKIPAIPDSVLSNLAL